MITSNAINNAWTSFLPGLRRGVYLFKGDGIIKKEGLYSLFYSRVYF